MHRSPFAALLGLVVTFSTARAQAEAFELSLPEDIERTWIGPELWANRLQDWRVADGRIECLEGRAGKPVRAVHLLTHRVSDSEATLALEMEVRTGAIGGGEGLPPDAAAGFLIGAGTADLDHRAAALVHHSPGPGGGILAGIDGKGRLFIADNETAARDRLASSAKEAAEGSADGVVLRLSARSDGNECTLELAARDPTTGERVESISFTDLSPDRLIGNLALVSHPGSGRGRSGARFWFRDWKVSGTKLDVDETRLAGPVLAAQHTLSEGVLKLTAQMMPVGERDARPVRLETREDDGWHEVARAPIVAPGWTATFRVPSWDASRDTPYRVAYRLGRGGGETQEYFFEGTIRKDPTGERTIVVAGFTGNHNTRGGVDRRRFDWSPRAMWFPHSDIVRSVRAHDPDVLFFSGDQIYEGASPTNAVRGQGRRTMLDYLYKWYLWCWAYRDLTRDIPCVTIPDDHDVYQGNLWGQGGRPTDKDDKGGYVQDADFVRMVERTQTSHLPDPYDPTPIDQGIGVYYTSMTYGEIGFAILEDRKFKSGCNGLVPTTTSGRADHVIDPDLDPETLDVPGAELLGDRQLRFLADWASDWKGQEMKVALSQTVFAGLATHHGGNLRYLVADLDSNGWPQAGRNRALRELRRGFVFHIGGDQHLSTIVHHGIDDWGDAGWSFTVPSIANFYPRAWAPKQRGEYRYPERENTTGDFRDGLGNPVTVYAATNPGRSMGHEPAALHDRMPGYGIVRLDKEERTITMECWPRYAAPGSPDAEQYEGWPKTIRQIENYGREASAHLPEIEVSGIEDPVVQVEDEETGEILYTLRIRGTAFRAKVFREGGRYTVRVSDPESGRRQVRKGIPPAEGSAERLEFEF